MVSRAHEHGFKHALINWEDNMNWRMGLASSAMSGGKPRSEAQRARKTCLKLAGNYAISELNFILCYPQGDLQCAIQRAVELNMLGVRELCLEGETEISGKRIIGKGTTSLVVKGVYLSYYVAVKTRRCDSNRVSLLHEAKILEKIKGLNIGPELLAASRNFLVWKFIDGVDFADWIRGVDSQEILREVLCKILYKLYLLDKLGISHNELSKPFNHIIIAVAQREPYIVDFESASTSSGRSNLTQFLGFLLGGQARLPDKLVTYLKVDREKLSDIKQYLKEYKVKRDFASVAKITELLLR
jgi:putative serine/threonine protein kinase